MKDNSLLAELRKNYSWLFEEQGFQVIQSDFREQEFGNSYVVLRNRTGWLRLVRDRGLRSVQVSDTGREEDWVFVGGDVLDLPGFSKVTVLGFDDGLHEAIQRGPEK